MMETTIRRAGDAITLYLRGRMTAGREHERLPDIIRRIAGPGVRSLILDLRRVSYMDITCLGEIVAVYKRLNRRGGQLRPVNVPPRVQLLLHLSHLTEVLVEPPVSPSIDTLAPGLGVSA